MTRTDLVRESGIGVARRALLALMVMAGVFVLVALPLLLTLQPGFVLYVGAADLFSLVVFVLPVVCLIPSRIQLRYWYWLLLASVGWMFGVLGFLLHETPWALLKEPNGASVIPITGLIIASASCGAYLPFLHSAAVASRRDDAVKESV